jgi:cyclopropane fatty-acyl-phospholipid synthase-like methyltransferase
MNSTSYISGWLRKLNLLTAAEKARYYLQKLKYEKHNKAFKMQHPEFILPPDFFIYETYRMNYQWYYDDGKNTAKEIAELFLKHGDLNKHGARMLDWGCGPGRIVRHLPGLLSKTEIHGTDYNKEYIQWCSENLTGIKFSTNGVDPPMNYDNSFFDAIMGLSIFTHLSDQNHYDWINELHRIIKPGGNLFITTHGYAYYSKLSNEEKKLFDSSQLIIRKYLNEGNRLYSSFQPVGFMKHLIAGKFEVVEFTAGKLENKEPAQDSWLLQKI